MPTGRMRTVLRAAILRVNRTTPISSRLSGATSSTSLGSALVAGSSPKPRGNGKSAAPFDRWTGQRRPSYAEKMFDDARPRCASEGPSSYPSSSPSPSSSPALHDAAAAPPVEKDKDPLVLYHWWGSSSEMAALNALASVFKAQYPGVTEKRTVAPDRGGSLFVILESLTKAGKPPDAIVMQTGYSMWPFVNAGLLAPVDDLWTAEGLEKVVPPTLRAMHKFDGHYYSVPIDVQRTEPHLVQQARPREARHRSRDPDHVGAVLRRGRPAARGRHGEPRSRSRRAGRWPRPSGT